jgi:hypothetical protein
MNFLKHVYREVKNINTNRPKSNAGKSIGKFGYCIVSNFISEEECTYYKEIIRDLIETKNNWKSEDDSDKRFYGAEEIIGDFFVKNEYVLDVLQDYIGTSIKFGLTMANQTRYINNNMGSGGG